MSEVVLYMVEHQIDGRTYCSNWPARSWEEAEIVAAKVGGKVLGDNIHQVCAIPAEQLMEFCAAISDEPIRWKYNAAEQLEAFLSMGWPERPEEA